MTLHVIKRGLDIPLKGRADGVPVSVAPSRVAYCPTEFRGVIPRLEAREGDEVKAGSPVFSSKAHPEMKFLSPVAGRVVEIKRGRRRVIEEIILERTGDGAVSFATHTLAALEKIGRDTARDQLLAGGLWPLLRTRPLDNVASPEVVPQSIVIGGMQTGPLQPGPEALLDDADADYVQAGAFVLRALTDGPVFLALAQGPAHPALAQVRGVEVHQFAGPHPAGDPAVQVNYLDPPRGTNQVWWLRAWEVALIGRLFLDGAFPTERTYAAAGPAVTTPRLVRTTLGAPAAGIVGATVDGAKRWIRGSVLTGAPIGPDGWGGFYDNAVTVIIDEVVREPFGWVAPQLHKWSSHRAFLAGFFKASTPLDLRPALRGGVRALVPIEAYRNVIATPDIDPVFLFRSVIGGDIEESIQLGVLDLTREEAALLTFVCPAKIEYDVLLQQALTQYEKEL